MHDKILDERQRYLAPRILHKFKDFYLCGGTAIALQIGHRKSIDFDLASPVSIHPLSLTNIILKSGLTIADTLVSTSDELTIVVDGVKLTFFHFPFPIAANHVWGSAQLKMPGLLDLCSMKAYALGRRCQWKDYVDLYFLLKAHIFLPELIENSERIFKGAFNSKLFREQLCYFEDIDMTEQVEYVDQPPDNEEICQFLTDIALS